MTSKLAIKRQKLQDRLVAAARSQIEQHGLQGLRAREVTSEAGCSLGALYNVFDDLDMLVVAVNGMTLDDLGQTLMAASASITDPAERLHVLAQAYYGFALEKNKLWSALFEHRMVNDRPVPDWHLEQHHLLLQHIVVSLVELNPSKSPAYLLALSRSIFAAVHGIIAISIEGRFVGFPAEELKSQLISFVDLLIAGLCVDK